MNFRELANVKLNEIPDAPLAPSGDYIFRISKQPIWGEAGDGKYETLVFPCAAVEAVNVDDDDLEAFGDVKAINLSVRFMSTKDPNPEEETRNAQTQARLRDFLLKHLGMPATTSLAQAIDESVGAEFVGTVTHRIDKNDKEKIYAEIQRTAPRD